MKKVIDLLVNVKFESEEDTNYLCEVPNLMESEWFANQWILWTCYWSMETILKFNTDFCMPVFWRTYYGKLLSLCPAVHMSYDYSKMLWWILIIFWYYIFCMFVIMEGSSLLFFIVFWFFISKLWDFKHLKKGGQLYHVLQRSCLFSLSTYMYIVHVQFSFRRDH